MSVTITRMSKSYGGPNVITDLSVTFPSGSISVLLGPSGCGKTTTLRCIAGLEDPDEGDIAIENTTVFSSERRMNLPPEKRNLGMVFQSYAIWPHMTVAENVMLPLRARKMPAREAADKAERMLKLVGLGGLGERSATKLSGGQQQRVAIARCVASDPRLILLDEPLSNLDAKLRVEMRQELKDLQRRLGQTMLFVTHDQEEAMSLGDVIYLYKEGRIEQQGSARELYLAPRSRYVAAFLGRANFIDAELQQSENRLALISKSGRQVLGHDVDADFSAGTAVVGMIRPEAWNVAGPEAAGIPGRIERVSFIGDRVELDVETDLGPQAVVKVGYGDYRPGENVRLSVDRQHLRIMPASE